MWVHKHRHLCTANIKLIVASDDIFLVIRHLGVGAHKELTLVLWSYWWKSVDNLALSCMQILIKMYFSEIYYQSLWNQLGRLACNSNGCNLEALLFGLFCSVTMTLSYTVQMSCNVKFISIWKHLCFFFLHTRQIAAYLSVRFLWKACTRL